jgi:hypothetical protein
MTQLRGYGRDSPPNANAMSMWGMDVSRIHPCQFHPDAPSERAPLPLLEA